MELKIEYIAVDDLKPYEKNNKKHEDFDIGEIAKSISKYEMIDPVGIWGKDNTIVEGHGRVLACKQLGIDKVPCIRLDHLTDEQRREYAIVHNKSQELALYDFDNLADELADLDLSDFDFNFGIDTDTDEDMLNDYEENEIDEKYTTKRDIPQYEITGEKPLISELVNTEKARELKEEILSSNLPEDIRKFLICAAERHNEFNYTKIAEYYAHADKEVQELMEKSALVIIDFNDAIKNGYVKLYGALEALKDDEA